MPNFTAGTTFGANDTVTNTKLNALIADAVINPEYNVSVNTGTVGTLSCTRGTVQTLTASTLSGSLTGGTYSGLINSSTGTYSGLINSSTGTYSGSIGTARSFTAGTINNFTSSSNATIAGMTVGTGSGSSVVVGSSTLGSNTGSLNVAFGYTLLTRNTTGSFNSAVGSITLSSNVSGSFNSAFGVTTLDANTGGSNSAFGYRALAANTTGHSNTAIGFASGNNTTGTNNTFIGNGAENTTGGSTASNTIVLGNSAIATLRCNTATISALSDARDKSNIEDIPVGIDFIKDLRPVKFTWNQRDGMRVGLTDSGFIAQESLDVVNKYNADWIGLVEDENKDQLAMSPGKLIPVLVKAIQQLSAKVDSLEAQLASK